MERAREGKTLEETVAAMPQQENGAGSPRAIGRNELTIEDAKRRIEYLEEKLTQEKCFAARIALERDRVVDFWELTRRRLEHAENALRVIHLKGKESRHKHCTEIKLFQDRILSLATEHARKETEMRLDMAKQIEQIRRNMEDSLAQKEGKLLAELAASRLEAQTAKEETRKMLVECERDKDNFRAMFEKKMENESAQFEERLESEIKAAQDRLQQQLEQNDIKHEIAVKDLIASQKRLIEQFQSKIDATMGQHESIRQLRPDTSLACHPPQQQSSLPAESTRQHESAIQQQPT